MESSGCAERVGAGGRHDYDSAEGAADSEEDPGREGRTEVTGRAPSFMMGRRPASTALELPHLQSC